MLVPVLLIGLLAIGAVDAWAANPPLAVKPGEDLFAPAGGASVATPPAPAASSPAFNPLMAPPPAAAVATGSGRALTGNPLWAIPLTSLTATRERPLFAPSRRVPPVARVAAPVAAAPSPPPKPAEPEKPQLTLLGTVAGGRLAAGVGLFLDPVSKTVVSLKAGDNHKGWTLRAVWPRQVELARGLDSAVLDLPQPDMRPGPAAPMLAAPAALPAAPVSANPGLPVNAARVLPPGVPPGARGVQPPVIQPPAAPAANPFEEAFRRRQIPPPR
jgi:general secretion pathway protein N